MVAYKCVNKRTVAYSSVKNPKINEKLICCPKLADAYFLVMVGLRPGRIRAMHGLPGPPTTGIPAPRRTPRPRPAQKGRTHSQPRKMQVGRNPFQLGAADDPPLKRGRHLGRPN